MKKLISLVLTASMLMFMFGCSSNRNETDPPQKRETIIMEEKKEEPQQSIQQSKTNEEEKEETKQSGIRPQIKEAIDAYETFIDRYVDFMVKYAESDNAMSMLMDYMKFVTEYAEAMEKIGALEGELNEEELLYYNEVTLRCAQKMLTVY